MFISTIEHEVSHTYKWTTLFFAKSLFSLTWIPWKTFTILVPSSPSLMVSEKWGNTWRRSSKETPLLWFYVTIIKYNQSIIHYILQRYLWFWLSTGIVNSDCQWNFAIKLMTYAGHALFFVYFSLTKHVCTVITYKTHHEQHNHFQNFNITLCNL